MNNSSDYKRANENHFNREDIPIEDLPENFLLMRIKSGTKVKNVVDFVKNAFETGKSRAVVWTSESDAIVKTISCVESIKRHFKLNQITRLSQQKVQIKSEDQESVVKTRLIPSIYILTSLDEIDPTTTGYQNSTEQTSSIFQPQPKEGQSFNVANLRNPKTKKIRAKASE